MTFEYHGPHEDFRRVEKAFNIVSNMERLYDPEEFHGYMYKEVLENIIARELFGHPTFTVRYRRNPGARHGHRFNKKLSTPEEDRKIAVVISRMEAQGIIKISKSGEMIKPLMNTEQWCATINATKEG